MSDLTDLEICKKIADIEGKQIMQITSACVFIFNDGESCQYFKEKVYNPLTDDALCFQLMVKYRVQITHEDPDYMAAQCEYDVKHYLNSESPNRAICLAIIESHEVQ